MWLAALVVLLVHATYIANGFVWLDHGDIEGKRAVLPLGSLLYALTERFGDTGYYRPLVTAIHSVTHAVFGTPAWGHHLVSVMLHVLVSIVAARFVHCFVKLERRELVMVTLIVGVHSANWFTVGTISNVQELLVVLWVMLAVINYVRWREEGKSADTSVPLDSSLRRKSKNLSPGMVGQTRQRSHKNTLRILGVSVPTRRNGLFFYSSGLWALGAFILALLSKETAIVWVPALLCLYEITNCPSRAQLKTLAAWWVAAALVGGTYALVHLTVVPEVWRPNPATLSWAEAIGTRLHAMGMLLIRLVNVMPPAASDAIQVRVVSGEGMVALLAMALGAWYILTHGIRSNGAKIAGMLTIMLAPALNLVPLPRFIAPHYTHFAVVSIAAVIVTVLQTFSKTRLGKALFVCAALWIMAMSAVTFYAGRRLQDDMTLFAPEVARDPFFREAHFYLGNSYFQRGSYQPAREAYEAALTVNPRVLSFVDRTAAQINYAGVLVAEGKLDDADAVLAQLSGKVPVMDQRRIDYNRALIASRQGDFARTVELLGGHDWTWPEPILLYIAALRKLGRDSEAKAMLRKLMSSRKQ